MEARNKNENFLWVFGYGSLCWHPGFKYKRSAVGHIRGFNRRFWQGNTTHRGTVEKPGRVVTLVEEKEGIVYGRAFQIQDTAALPYLENRECSLGGYVTTIATFHSREGNRSFPVIIYIATNKNKHWLGEAPLQNIAKQISECSGPNGHNVEYLLRLAEFMHRYLPEAQDEHLFTLELLVRSRIKETNMCLDTLMGKRDYNIDLEDVEIDAKDEDSDLVTNNATNNLRKNSFQFTLQVPDKTLRCLKM
ncbi:putative glutathione-specific gamma-glutamylcyclotransferase 2 isoform X1 [Bombus fervidus]|uniref:putative glutathione-specific gamma-glutamylcyclotransferase 2 isoform X1 n=1 Tax=Bombus fervidus TaxID=203811 RepID=UPI003AB66DD9